MSEGVIIGGEEEEEGGVPTLAESETLEDTATILTESTDTTHVPLASTKASKPKPRWVVLL